MSALIYPTPDSVSNGCCLPFGSRAPTRNQTSAYYHKFAIVYGRQLLDRSLTVAARKAQ